jgi:hypothetical protein
MAGPHDEPVRCIEPGSFDASAHFYPRALNAQIHPLVSYFFNLGNARIAERFCHLHPEAEPQAVREALSRVPRFFRWGGADLFCVTTPQGVRKIVVIETNSCPSGQKSMPLLQDNQELAGYRVLIEGAFFPYLRGRKLPAGALAVLFDKNAMEAGGYAAALATIAEEPVMLVPMYEDDPDPKARFDEEGVLQVRHQGDWIQIRGAVRYVTQRPWNRIPILARTLILNPVIACLAGGRNKMLAAKAYDLFNAELHPSGLRIRTPETIWDVVQAEVPMWVARMGGTAVVKDPYSNAGQGVRTITNQEELDAFMESEPRYGRFIVQALIGNRRWSSQSRQGELYHVGTVPSPRGEIYAADLRFMVGGGPGGFFPVAAYARRARRPLPEVLDSGQDSWEVLGTNLSRLQPDGSWTSESERLLLMDRRDFNRLGIGIDDLIEAYIQTVLAVSAIDSMAERLVSKKGKFRRRFFGHLNPDPRLLEELTG